MNMTTIRMNYGFERSAAAKLWGLWALLLIGSLSASVAAGDETIARTDVPARVQRMMESARRSARGEDSPERLAAAAPQEALNASRAYIRDTHERVRHTAESLIWQAAKRVDSAPSRQEAVASLVELTRDPEPLVWQHAGRHALEFRTADFNETARQTLAQAMNDAQPRREIVRLAGLAEMRDQLPRLRELLSDESTYERDPDAPGRWYGTVSWSARLALARMGSDEDLQKCLQLVEAEDRHVERITVLLRDVGYIGRPAAMRLLQRYLESDLVLPETKAGIPGTAYNQYALDVLAEVVDGFPVAKSDPGAYSAKDLGTARAWMRNVYGDPNNR